MAVLIYSALEEFTEPPKRWERRGFDTAIYCRECGTGLDVFIPTDPAAATLALADLMREHEAKCP